MFYLGDKRYLQTVEVAPALVEYGIAAFKGKKAIRSWSCMPLIPVLMR